MDAINLRAIHKNLGKKVSKLKQSAFSDCFSITLCKGHDSNPSFEFYAVFKEKSAKVLKEKMGIKTMEENTVNHDLPNIFRTVFCLKSLEWISVEHIYLSNFIWEITRDSAT